LSNSFDHKPGTAKPPRLVTLVERKLQVIKMNAGYSDKRQATQLVFCFSEINLIKMMDENRPIHILGEEIGVPEVGFHIFAGHGKEQIVGRIKPVLEKFYPKDAKIPVPHIEKKFFIFPIGSKPLLFAIGLDDPAYKVLRDKGVLNFRCRTIGEKVKSVEVHMCWGPTEEILEEAIYASGLVDANTKIRRS
jgi:hypothetical protein